MANSLFKAYAKQAKKRLKEGFWSDVKNQRNYFELVAATNGGSADFAVNRQKQALKNQLYNREQRRRSFTEGCAAFCRETRW